ncbi:hypothetical protein ACUNV4_19635 [Granulosicoccus sp. 3-233]|uniref:hypothetical protein n=1 Tax=Granulosicoccus sp. 3-233 TaxID=3417969 RepID=UPI003D339522
MKLRFVMFIALLSLSACSADNDDAPAEQRLLDRTWLLVRYTQLNGNEVDIVTGSQFRFQASADTGEVTAQLDCNVSSGGSYQLGDGFIALQFGPFTELDCPVASEDGHAEQLSSIQSLAFQSGVQDGGDGKLMVEMHEHGLVLVAPNGRWLAFTELMDQD